MKNYIAILILLSSCIHDKASDEKITIINNSKRKISFTHSRLYPDTSLTETFSSGGEEIAPGSSRHVETRLGWSLEFERNPKGILNFFISDYDTIIKYGGDKWRNDYLILKRYEFTKDSLQKMNWTITY